MIIFLIVVLSINVGISAFYIYLFISKRSGIFGHIIKIFKNVSNIQEKNNKEFDYIRSKIRQDFDNNLKKIRADELKKNDKIDKDIKYQIKKIDMEKELRLKMLREDRLKGELK